MIKKINTSITVAAMFSPIMDVCFANITEKFKLVIILRFNAFFSAFPFIDYISICRIR